jgi:hypothetical protein
VTNAASPPSTQNKRSSLNQLRAFNPEVKSGTLLPTIRMIEQALDRLSQRIRAARASMAMPTIRTDRERTP